MRGPTYEPDVIATPVDSGPAKAGEAQPIAESKRGVCKALVATRNLESSLVGIFGEGFDVLAAGYGTEPEDKGIVTPSAVAQTHIPPSAIAPRPGLKFMADDSARQRADTAADQGALDRMMPRGANDRTAACTQHSAERRRFGEG